MVLMATQLWWGPFQLYHDMVDDNSGNTCGRKPKRDWVEPDKARTNQGSIKPSSLSQVHPSRLRTSH